MQDRAFVMALGVSYEDDQYELTFALSDSSPQSKENGEKDNKEESTQIRTYSSLSLDEIENMYNHGSSKRLDYRHLQALILDSTISSSTEKLEGLSKYLEDNYEIARSVRLFYYPGDVKELLDSKANLSGGIGDYLKKLENNNYRKNALEPTTVGNLIDSFSTGKGLVIPILKLNDDKLEIDGAAVFQGSEYVKSFTDEELNLYNVIKSLGKELSFHSPNDIVFKLSQFETRANYLYNDYTPIIQLSVSGTADILSCPDENYESAILEINNYINNSVMELLNASVKLESKDYFNIYFNSGLKSRSIWLNYHNRNEKFLNDVVFEINTDIKALR